MIISHCSLLRIRNFSGKTYRGNQNKYCTYNRCFLYPAVYEIMWKNIVERGRSNITMWRMWITCWIPKAMDTHLEYVILIAFHGSRGYRRRLCVTLQVNYLPCLTHINRQTDRQDEINNHFLQYFTKSTNPEQEKCTKCLGRKLEKFWKETYTIFCIKCKGV